MPAADDDAAHVLRNSKGRDRLGNVAFGLQRCQLGAKPLRKSQAARRPVLSASGMVSDRGRVAASMIPSARPRQREGRRFGRARPALGRAACGTRPARTRYTGIAGLLPPKKGRARMLGSPLAFPVIALIAAAPGFGGIAGASAGSAKTLFGIFLVLFVGALVGWAMPGWPPI